MSQFRQYQGNPQWQFDPATGQIAHYNRVKQLDVQMIDMLTDTAPLLNRAKITTNNTTGRAAVGDIITVTAPPGMALSNIQGLIDKGAGFVAVSGFTGATYTLTANEIAPAGQQWPLKVQASLSTVSTDALMLSNPVTVPAAPTIGTATAGVLTVTAPYTAPTDTGGSAITSYDALLYVNGVLERTLKNVPNPAVFTDAQYVQGGVTYQIRIRANNAIGTGPLSAFSNAVTAIPDSGGGAVVSGVSLIGPTAGIAGQPSNKFYLAATTVSGSATYLASNPAGDTFTPSNPTLTAAVKSATFTLTQLAVGTSAVNITNSNGYENPAAASYVTADSSASIFLEPWNSASANWAQGANPTTVSGNRMYGTAGAGAGMNHSYALTAGQNMRVVVPFTIAAGSSSGGVAFGVNQDAAGATPTTGLGNVFGLYFNFTAGTVQSYNNGTVTQVSGTLTRGDFLGTITIDPTYISISADKTDNTVGFFIRRPRAGFNINNIALFNSDALGATGSSVGPMSARKEIQTIEPRIFGEGSTASGMMWTGNSAATVGYAVWLPPSYDSSLEYPLVLMFHGDNSDELAFNSDPTYPIMRRAFAAAGYICMSVGIAANKSTWGSQASVDAYFAAWQYIYNKCRISNTVFLGCSMGGIESLNSLSKGTIPGVAAWIGYSPTTNLAQAYATSWTAKINTAYGINGGNPYATATAGYDPLLAAPDAFRKVPMLFAAATDDAVVPKSNNTDPMVTRMTGVSAEVVSIAGITGGHSFVPSAGVLAQMIAFADKYAKTPNPNYLRTRTAMAAVAAGTGDFRVVWAGDSTEPGARALGPAANSFRTNSPAVYRKTALTAAQALPVTTSNWLGDQSFGQTNSYALTAYDTRITLPDGAGYTHSGTTRTVAGSMQQNNVNTNRLAFLPEDNYDTCDLIYATGPGLGAGSFTRSGSTAVPFNQAGTSGVAKVTITGALSTSIGVAVARTSGGSYIIGMDAYNSTVKSIRMYSAGWSGGKIADWIVSTTGFDPLPALVALNPDLVIVRPGINDAVANTAPATYKAQLATYVDTLLSAGINVALATHYPSNVASASKAIQDVIAQMAREVAAERGLMLRDTYLNWGSWVNSNSLGYMADNLHPLELGYQTEAVSSVKFLMRVAA